MNITELLYEEVLLYKEVFYERGPLKPLNKILEKYLRKSSLLVKLSFLEMNPFTRFFKVFAKSLGLLP